MDLTKLTIEQLKALAYDSIVDLERIQNNLKFLNEEISKRKTPLPVKEIKDDKKK